MSNIICGKTQAQDVLYKVKVVTENLTKNYGIIPKVCIIIVGNDYASNLYVKNKVKAANHSGILAEVIHLKDYISEILLFDLIKKYNSDSSVHGIIVQMPLPSTIDSYSIMNSINYNKDVDGFNAINVGNLSLNRPTCMVPCTALGCLTLIKSVVKDIAGMHVVVVGRSNIVGMPLSKLLTHQNATVTICHSYTKNLDKITKIADIVVLATGKAEYFDSKYFSPSSIVIDVGINRTKESKIVGDVDFFNVQKTVKAISPVPGGVGPMTVAYLMANTVKAACISCGDTSYKNLYL